MGLQTLNQKHRTFVDVYDGDDVKSMQLAGFQGATQYLKVLAKTLLDDPLIQAAIRDRDKYRSTQAGNIATREERQMLWSEIMRNKDPHKLEERDPVTNMPVPPSNIPMQYRLKASELLGKSEADFVDKLQVEGNLTITDIIQKSYLPDDASIEAIEAEYYKAKGQAALPVPEISEPQTLDDLI